MNKTVTININKTIYHIDEPAYSKLNDYLNSLKHHFSTSDSADEIMLDIEARISELLQMKMKNKDQIISIEDVEEIINIMGKPEEMSNEGNADNSQKHESGEQTNWQAKRLYRDTDNRILGGVCSGIGYYFRVDPVLIRIVFLLTFFFAGPLIYLIAWLIIPKASTTAEKIHMRGESMDINTIERNIKEEFNDVKNKFKEYKRDINSRRGADFFYNIIKYMGRFAGLMIGLIALALGIALFTGMTFSLAAIKGNWMVNHEFGLCLAPSFITETITDSYLGLIGLVLLIGVPILLMVWGGLVILLGIKGRFKWIGYSGFVLWLVGVFFVGYVSIRTVEGFQKKSFTKTEMHFKANAIKIRFNDLSKLDDCLNTAGDKINIHHLKIADCDEGFKFYGEPEYKIESSLNDSVTIKIIKTARGISKQDAYNRASQITYNIINQDSVIILDKYFLLNDIDKWRDQVVKIIIRVPDTKKNSILPEQLKTDFNNFEECNDNDF